MPRIALLKDNFLINFDDHCLYLDGYKIIELNKRPLDVLEYLCSNPNCYKKVEDINNYLEEGCLSATAIRGIFIACVVIILYLEKLLQVLSQEISIPETK